MSCLFIALFNEMEAKPVAGGADFGSTSRGAGLGNGIDERDNDEDNDGGSDDKDDDADRDNDGANRDDDGQDDDESDGANDRRGGDICCITKTDGSTGLPYQDCFRC